MTAPTDRQMDRTEGALWALKEAEKDCTAYADYLLDLREHHSSDRMHEMKRRIRALAASVRSGEVEVPHG